MFLKIVLTIVLTGSWPTAAVEFADTVLLNGTIHTADAENRTVKALAIRDDKFVYTGDDSGEFIGPATRVIDLGGRPVIPGLIDAHSHPGWVSLSSGLLYLEDTSSKAALMESIRKMVEENPDRKVLVSGFWPNEYFEVTGPTRQELDQIEPNRPVIIYDAWAHTVWANSKALDAAGVTPDTPDVVPGLAFYQRDQDGRATGWITESAATVFTNNFQSVTAESEQILIDYLDWYRSMGVLTVLDAGNFGLDREIYGLVSRLDQQGRLPVRYHGAYTLFVPDDYDSAVATLKRLGRDYNSDKVRIDTLKVFYDGVLETRTADVSKDYLDTPGNSGASLLTRAQLSELIVDLDRESLNLHIHAVGDAATSRALDAIEDARDSMGRTAHISITICHLEVVRESDIPRFAELGVVANFTPHWWSGGDLDWLAQGIGKKTLYMQRAGSFTKAGAMVTFSSDITDKSEWLSDRANPFLGMQMAHNRQEATQGPAAAVFPQRSDAVSRSDFLAAYTRHSAVQLKRDADIGSIEVGKIADLVVLDQDPISVNRYEIYKTRPVAVFMKGELVSGALDQLPGPD